MLKFRFLACLIAFVGLVPRIGSAQKGTCFETTVSKPSPLMGNNGEVVVLSNGSIWEILYEYEYLYEYFPTVVACPASGKLIVKGKSLNARMIRAASDTSKVAALNDAEIIESRIDGDFDGWEGETIVKLINGQVWIQTDGKYKYKYKSSPRVTIIKLGRSFEMLVDGLDVRVKVERLK
jgi:hypothetical protein